MAEPLGWQVGGDTLSRILFRVTEPCPPERGSSPPLQLAGDGHREGGSLSDVSIQA